MHGTCQDKLVQSKDCDRGVHQKVTEAVLTCHCFGALGQTWVQTLHQWVATRHESEGASSAQVAKTRISTRRPSQFGW